MMEKTGSASITETVKEVKKEDAGISCCPKCGAHYLGARGFCPNCSGDD
jgi:uncharacterized OB-fold protein